MNYGTLTDNPYDPTPKGNARARGFINTVHVHTSQDNDFHVNVFSKSYQSFANYFLKKNTTVLIMFSKTHIRRSIRGIKDLFLDIKPTWVLTRIR